MDRLAPLWGELLRQQEHSIFQRFAWNRLAADVFSDRLSPFVVAVEGDSGAAILPAAINHATGHLELLGECLFDYRDVLHAGTRKVLHLAWEELSGCGKPLQVISVEEPAAMLRWNELPIDAFARAPHVHRGDISESAFRHAHPRLRRQLRRMAREGVHLNEFSGNDCAVIRHLYRCKREHFAVQAENIFLDQRRCDFVVAAAALEGNRCNVFTLQDKGGTLVAGLVTFLDGDVRRFYTTYFHPGWGRYSPGAALLYEVTARSLGAGLTCDYMTGEYPYKMRFATSSRPLYKLELSAQQLTAFAKRIRLSTAA